MRVANGNAKKKEKKKKLKKRRHVTNGLLIFINNEVIKRHILSNLVIFVSADWQTLLDLSERFIKN